MSFALSLHRCSCSLHAVDTLSMMSSKPVPACLALSLFGPGQYVPPKMGSKSGVTNTFSGHPPPPFVACKKSMYCLSISGLSSLSILIGMKCSLSSCAIRGSSKDSWAITWLSYVLALISDRRQAVLTTNGKHYTQCSQRANGSSSSPAPMFLASKAAMLSDCLYANEHMAICSPRSDF